MNIDAGGRFDPEHLQKWQDVTRAYLAGSLAELRAAETEEKATHLAVPPVRGGRSMLLSWAYRALLHLLKRAGHAEEDPLKVLESGLYFHVSLMAKYPAVPLAILTWYAQTDDARVRSRIRGVIDQYEKRLSQLIDRAKKQGLVRPNIDARTAAGVLVGFIQGLVLRMGVGSSQPETLLREAAAVFPVYLDGIRASSTQFSAGPVSRGTVMTRQVCQKWACESAATASDGHGWLCRAS